MDENRFDDVIRNLPGDFKVPPEPPLEEMWRVIESAHFDAPLSARAPRGFMRTLPWLPPAPPPFLRLRVWRVNPGEGPLYPPPPTRAPAGFHASPAGAPRCRHSSHRHRYWPVHAGEVRYYSSAAIRDRCIE